MRESAYILAKLSKCIYTYNSLQCPGSKTPKSFIPYHSNWLLGKIIKEDLYLCGSLQNTMS